MLHTFWLVQGIAAKNWYTTESFDDTHNSVLSDWQTVDRLLTYCGEVNLVKCKDGYFTKSVVTKAMTVANPYYTATKIEVKPLEVKEVRTMTLNQIKQEIAALLNVDVVCSDEVRQVLNTELSNTELSKSNWKLKATWQAALTILNNAGYDRTGVNESLGEVDGGSLQPALINDSSNDSETPVNYIIVVSDYPQVVIKSEGNTPKELNEVTEEQLLDSLYTDKGTAEMMFPGSYYKVIEVNPVNIRQQLTKHFNLEQESIVATVTNDNIYYVLVHSQADEVYIDTRSGFNAKRLVDCTDKELKDSSYVNQLSVQHAQQNKVDNAQVVTISSSNIRQELKDYFSNRVMVSELNCYLPKDEASTKGYYYKGIPVEHYNFNHEVYIDSVLKDTTGVLISKYLGTHSVSFNDGEQRKSDVSLLEAVKLASEWLGVNTAQVPSSEQAIQPSSLERKSIYA